MTAQMALRLPEGVPHPPHPGGRHCRHIVEDESLRAWRKVLQTLADRERRVLAWIDGCGWEGCTGDEGWRAAPWCDSPNGFCPRITGLKEAGAVVWRSSDGGRTGDYRPTAKGNRAKVWVSSKVWILYHLGEL